MIKSERLILLILTIHLLLSSAQKSKKSQLSNQDILTALNTQPLVSPDQGSSNNQNNVVRPVLNVEPLSQKTVNGGDVITSLASACKALQAFISRSEFVKQRMSVISPSLLPWLYAQKIGFATECGHSSYSNALHVFAAACNVFETCPLPALVMDFATMSSGFSTNFQTPFNFTQGFNMPVIPMVPRPLVLRPEAPNGIAPTLKESKPKQIRVIERKIKQRERKIKPKPTQQRINVPTKQVPVQLNINKPVAPIPPVAVQPVTKPVPQRQKPVPQKRIFLQRMPVPSMASLYPLWFYGFRQVPSLGRSVGVKASQPATSPRPEHDSSD